MAWVSAEQFAREWIGYDCPADEELITAWLGKAERKIKREIPGIQDRLDAGNEPGLVEDLADVVVAMVTRVFRNPEGIRQIQGTSGPLTESKTFGGDNPGALELLPDELRALTKGSRGGRKIASVDLIPPWSPFYREDQQ